MFTIPAVYRFSGKVKSMDKRNSEHEREVKRTVSLRKAEQFKKYAVEYIEAKKIVPRGFKLANQYRKQKDKIREVLGASEADWRDWKWQLSNRISDVETLENIFPLTQKQKKDFETIPPYIGIKTPV